MGKYKIEVDKNACQGFGACVELCSEFFELSDVDGKTTIEGGEEVKENDEVVAETLEVDELECIREAAEACPFVAIHITDLETGEELI
ncbi:ferredoxin [Candidatus Bathyarchaeota archaeon]|nr:ferredoxin [Candidatus Bathyarchaeota archaeon]NIR17431.1 ferredoxin [Desulfobacterales bacterium]NIV68214.1 ferredoxin [Candidatus Bathyarchaeota archaeon]NIW16470.1 ferredoxin [Candidatus Bathyarchaeota archaeon]NIW34744.1 ferredoxin [Candidatus Bathyarchaeota archaeon]